MNIKKITAAVLAGTGILVLASCSAGNQEHSAENKNTTNQELVESPIHFQVQSLGGSADGNTRVVYTADGVNNVEVGEIGDFWEITLPFNRFASVTFVNGTDTLATCTTHMYNEVVDTKTVGQDSWEQCQAK